MEKYLEIALLLMPGIRYTLGLFFITMIGSMPLGLMLTLFKTTRFRPIVWLTNFYVYIMRGTPLLLQLYFFYYGLPFIPGVGKYLVLDRFVAACVAFILNYAAYFCEIFRGGILSIDKGQYEAARVLGLTKQQTLFKIVLPQMLRVTLPSIGNEWITLVKDTALITVIGVTEIIYFAKATVNRESDFTAYIVAAGFYLVFNYVITELFARLEKKYAF